MKRKVTELSDADLHEMEGEESFTFPPAERRVVTQPLDLSVQTLLEQWEAKVLLIPEIQREYVWDNGKASRLIESLLLNIPIPVIYLAETADATYEIFDGHQRVKSIVRFAQNEFALSGLAVLPEYTGLRFHQLPAKEQRFLKMRTLRAVIITVESHPNMKFEIFERLNTGSISLNAQELRNSIYRGPFNSLLHELAAMPAFRTLIGTKSPRRRMVDEELILRFFALRERIAEYRTPLKRFLNTYMAMVQHATAAELMDMRRMFEATVDVVTTLLGASAFRILDQAGDAIDSTVNRALFDAQMLACSWVVGDVRAADSMAARRAIGRLFGREAFLDAIQRATGDRARTVQRLQETVAALSEAQVRVRTPIELVN